MSMAEIWCLADAMTPPETFGDLTERDAAELLDLLHRED